MLILWLIFVSVGIYVLLYWCWQLLKEKHAENWPVVDGKVTESQFIAAEVYSTDVLKFTYAYEFLGKKYTSSWIDFFGFPANPSELKAFSNKHPVGSTINVYCNPLNGKGILQPNSPASAKRTRNNGIILLVIGGVFLFFTLLM